MQSLRQRMHKTPADSCQLQPGPAEVHYLSSSTRPEHITITNCCGARMPTSLDVSWKWEWDQWNRWRTTCPGAATSVRLRTGEIWAAMQDVVLRGCKNPVSQRPRKVPKGGQCSRGTVSREITTRVRSAEVALLGTSVPRLPGWCHRRRAKFYIAGAGCARRCEGTLISDRSWDNLN